MSLDCTNTGKTHKSMNLFEKELTGSIGKKLIRKKQTIAVAESVTSGLLQFALSSVPDAATFYQGGMTAYNIGQKYKHLDVEPIHAESVNCVSPKVAAEMAIKICERYCSDWGIAITGYATPVPESGNKIFCFYAIACKNKIKGKGKITTVKKDPSLVQLEYATTVLKKLRGLL
jgi:nicotinamide-nucleotide amidase